MNLGADVTAAATVAGERILKELTGVLTQVADGREVDLTEQTIP